MEYLEITQQDLRREFQLARSHPRHLTPRLPMTHSVPPPRADLNGVIASLKAARHVLEMFRRSLAEGPARHLLDRLANRSGKILAATRELNPTQK